MSDVYVIGTDMIRFGRYAERSVEDMGAEAGLLALADAKLTIRDINAFYCGNLGEANGQVGQRIMKQIGQTGIPVVNTANACATGATAFREGWIAVHRRAQERAAAIHTRLAARLAQPPALVAGTLAYRRAVARFDLDDLMGRIALDPAAACAPCLTVPGALAP